MGESIVLHSASNSINKESGGHIIVVPCMLYKIRVLVLHLYGMHTEMFIDKYLICGNQAFWITEVNNNNNKYTSIL